jgi:hypothetical protein
MTVGRMLREMSSRELAEWKAFLMIERSGALTQRAVDVSERAKAAFAPLMLMVPGHGR